MGANQPNNGHEWILANLGRYVNKEMSAGDERAVVEHLAQCQICQERLAALATGGERETPGPAAYVVTPAAQPGVERSLRGYNLIGDQPLEDLANFKSERAPVVSVYLDMSPQERPGFKTHEDLKGLLDAKKRELAGRPREEQRAFAAAAERVDDWFAREYDRKGKGLALFACSSPELFRAFRLPQPVPNRLFVSDRPHLGPLLMLAKECDRYLIILVDKKTARLFIEYMGAIEEYSELNDQVESHAKAGGQHAEKNQRHSDMHVLWHVKRAVEAAEELWERLECDWLIVGGTEEALSDLREQLPKAMAERLVEQIAVSLKAQPDEVLAEARRLEQENERKREGEQVNLLLTKALGSGPGVVGLDQTLEAIVAGNLMTIVVDETLHRPGFECPNCHFMGSTPRERCPLCGSTLEQEQDIVERALERALDAGANVEILRSEDARKQLERYGKIGAFLRYSTTSENQPSGGLPGPR